MYDTYVGVFEHMYVYIYLCVSERAKALNIWVGNLMCWYTDRQIGRYRWANFGLDLRVKSGGGAFMIKNGREREGNFKK